MFWNVKIIMLGNFSLIAQIEFILRSFRK